MKRYKLFIDESGREHQSHQSKYYILIGCIIEAAAQHELEVRSNQIKYRYWKRTDIVFHSREIDRNAGDFAIFAGNEKLKKEFMSDLVHLINSAPIKVTCCVVDKDKVYKVPWKHTTIIHKTADSVVLDFLRLIYSKTSAVTGVIVHEASGYEKDTEYLKAFNKVVTPAWTRKHPEFPNIRERLTSITFATKLNHDIECEIADLLSYAALRKYKANHGIETVDAGSYEEKLIAALDRKLLLPVPTPKTKKSGKYDYLNKVVGFHELP
ncbi:MAG TPA: DUF3800 domain-containing protein [Methylomirabilota bacterium]|nr:DUF3800 domain-containing protein [Methylomirabilota bacterium]